MGKIVPLSQDKNCPVTILFATLYRYALSCFDKIFLAGTVLSFGFNIIAGKLTSLKTKWQMKLNLKQSK